MLKAVGAVFVFSCCCLVGLSRALTMKRRVKSLEALLAAVRRIDAEVSFSKKRLERIFNETAQQSGITLFAYAAENMRTAGFKSAWCAAVGDACPDMALTDTDRQYLLQLSAIGDYTGGEQKKCLHAAERLIELSLAGARDELSKSAKLFSSGGVLVGMLAVILLL